MVDGVTPLVFRFLELVRMGKYRIFEPACRGLDEYDGILVLFRFSDDLILVYRYACYDSQD